MPPTWDSYDLLLAEGYITVALDNYAVTEYWTNKLSRVTLQVERDPRSTAL